MNIIDLQSRAKCDWCPGCGDYGILAGLKQAISELGIDQKDYLIVSGIGCGPKFPHWIKLFGFHSLHGRALPVAEGAKMANPKLKVIVIMGDGDCYAIGLNHFIHACRRNIDITAIVCNNSVYGLTTGQTSPTSAKGTKSKSTPFGSVDEPIRPVNLSLTCGASFAARAYANNIVHLKEVLKKAIMHKGFSHIDVLQPCVTFHDTRVEYQQKTFELEKNGWKANDFGAALKKSLEFNGKIPIGVFYASEERPSFESQLPTKTSLVNKDLSKISITDSLKEFE